MVEAERNRQNAIRVYLQPAFLICAAVLALSGTGLSIAVKSLGVYLKKQPLALNKPLELLDEEQLAPYKVVGKERIENEDVLKSLGTEDYIQWLLDDPNVPPDSPVRECSLFITYYDVPDLVPHVPDECFVGGGYQKLGSDSVTFRVNKDGSAQEIPGRYVVFTGTKADPWGASAEFSVLYLFHVNEEYANSRNATRNILNKNLFGKYSYFSKVEWKFFNTRFGRPVYPGKEEALAASERLLSVILPILEKDHWPSGYW
jgi:hypothetical protein